MPERLIRHRPAAPLDSYVECFWWSRRDAPQLCCEHMLPSGSAQLIFALHETPILCVPGASANGVSWSRGVLHGPQWNYFISGPKPRGAVVGVSFRPGAAGAVLGLPITEFADRHIPIEEVWGARALELHERLLAARDPKAIFGILERELGEHLEGPLRMHPAVLLGLSPHVQRLSGSVADVQREAGYSSKHFIALFRAAVGLTPKHYYRVRRFATVLSCLAAADATDLANATGLADLAASAGYSDQAHLTREFRAFAGVTPTQYRPRSADSAFHHRVRAALLDPAG